VANLEFYVYGIVLLKRAILP